MQPNPPQQAVAKGVVAGGTVLPSGALYWGFEYFVGDAGRLLRAAEVVPIDQFGHVVGSPYRCRKCKPVLWYPAKLNGVPICPVHNRRMEKREIKKAFPIPVKQIWLAVERPLRPVWAPPALAAAGVVVDAGHVPTLVLVGAAPVVGFAATRVARRLPQARGWLRDHADLDAAVARASRQVGMLTSAGLAWLTLAAGIGVAGHGWPVEAAMWGSALALWALPAATWWRRLRAQRTRPKPEVVNGERLPNDDERAARDAAKTWTAEVDIPGTELTPETWKRIKGGWQAVVHATKRGALNGLGGDNMNATVRRVAAGYDVPRAAIGWIDEYDDSPNKALLLVQPNSPLRDNITWQPPGVLPIGDAVLHMGMRIDGSPLRTRLWTPGWGAPSRYVVGTKGSGKTESLRLLLLGMLEAQVTGPFGLTRLVAPFLHDPKRGKDFGAFRRQVSGFSIDLDMLHLIVDALVREMDRRYDTLGSSIWFDDFGRAREGETAFDPTIHGPVISLVIDELHDVVKDQTLMAKLDPFGRKMRAAGIEIVGASHMSTLSDTGSQVFRDMMAGGEAWLFRTTSALNAALATGGQVTQDPRGLPREPGSVLYASGEEDTMQSRTAFVPSEPLYNRLYDERGQSKILPVEWPAETLEAFGVDFVQWMSDCQARQPGSPPPPKPRTVAVGAGMPTPVAVARPDVKCVDAVLAVLASVRRPVDHNELVRMLSARGHVFATRTVTGALSELKKAERAVKVNDLWGLSPQARSEFDALEQEHAAVAAEERAA